MPNYLHIAEIHDCDEKVANKLIENGWELINHYATAHLKDSNDFESVFVVGRPKWVNYTLNQAVDSCNLYKRLSDSP